MMISNKLEELLFQGININTYIQKINCIFKANRVKYTTKNKIY